MNNTSSTEFENKAENARVIVSLTTYPGRIDRVHISIESLLHQTRKPDMVVLWLAEEQFPDKEQGLPEKLLSLQKHGLSIEWCHDIKSYKKLIPSAKKWPDDIIITADDDIIYRIDMVESLLEAYENHPDCVCTTRSHLMLFDETGKPLPYNDWKPEYSGLLNCPRMALFPTTGAGTLFPPGILPEETFDEQAFMSLCPKADDVWIKCMLTLADVPVVQAVENTRLMYVEGTQSGDTLYAHNLTGNDSQLAAVLERYNNVGGEEHPEDTLLGRMNDSRDHEPEDAFCQKYRTNRSYVNEKTGIKVSIIIAVKNNERTIKRCLSSALSQTEKAIEIICADLGSSDKSAGIIEELSGKDSRLKLLRLDGSCSPAMARRAAVLDCRGEYCIFPEADGILAGDACQELYERAEKADADILSFTGGILPDGAGSPEERFTGYAGQLRNTRILPHQFRQEYIPLGDLHSCIFSTRMSRRAYYHVTDTFDGGSLYEYFLLCRSAEVYAGEVTPVYYASPAGIREPRAIEQSIAAMAEFADFADATGELSATVNSVRSRSVYSCVLRWHEACDIDRFDIMSGLMKVWRPAELSAALAKLNDRRGPQSIRPLAEQPYFVTRRSVLQNVGVAVMNSQSAEELFVMTEVLDCIAVNHSATLIGVSKTAASTVVSSAKAVCTGDSLTADENIDEYTFACGLDEVIEENGLEAIVVSAHSRRFTQIVLHCRMRGVAVIALLAGTLCDAMLDCSRQNSSLIALRLADIVVTDAQEQQRMLGELGVRAEHIPFPAIRLMGGRSGGRASANAVVWAGNEREIGEACEIFSLIKKGLSAARMLMYVDGIDSTESIADSLPEGITVRRLRPDYGIFADAAVHLMTKGAATEPAVLRAARTMGVPTVMYALPGERRESAGTIAVKRCDRSSAAAEVLRLLADREMRDRMSAQAKSVAALNSRDAVASRWDQVIDNIAGRKMSVLPEPDKAFEAAMIFYEDGAHFNAMRLEQYEARCENYEQKLVDAEQRRTAETEALQAKIDQLREQLREKEHARARVSGELEDLRGSTLYKVGSAITALPRKLKKLIGGNGQNS